jgi:hypothetical protein
LQLVEQYILGSNCKVVICRKIASMQVELPVLLMTLSRETLKLALFVSPFGLQA